MNQPTPDTDPKNKGRTMYDEVDIGSGERSPGQHETEEMIRGIPGLPPSNQPSDADRPDGDKPGAEGGKPGAGGGKPGAGGDQPRSEGGEPSAEGSKPATEGDQPATEAGSEPPANGQGTPGV